MSAMRDAIAAELDKAVRNMQALAADAAMQAQLEQAVGLCTGALRDGRKLLFAGNGGSAADAQHWAGELVSRFYYDRPGLAAIALTTRVTRIIPSASLTRTSQNTAECTARVNLRCLSICGGLVWVAAMVSDSP